MGLLEVLNSHLIVQLSVFRLETTRVPRKNGDLTNKRIWMKPDHYFKAIGLLEVLNSHFIVQLSVFRLKTIRGPRNERRWQEVLWYQELLRGGEILTTFLTKRDGNTSEVRKINCWVAVISRFTQNTNKLCWTEGNKVVDENRNHRGARMVLPIMNSIEFLEELIRLMMITTQLSRDFMQM